MRQIEEHDAADAGHAGLGVEALDARHVLEERVGAADDAGEGRGDELLQAIVADVEVDLTEHRVDEIVRDVLDADQPAQWHGALRDVRAEREARGLR